MKDAKIVAHTSLRTWLDSSQESVHHSYSCHNSGCPIHTIKSCLKSLTLEVVLPK